MSMVEFTVAGEAYPRQVSRSDQRQKTTGPRDPNGDRPIWSVRLSAFDKVANSVQQIFVDIPGARPEVRVNGLATLTGLTFTPWAAAEQGPDGKWRGKVMASYRADSITMAEASARRAA